MEETMCSTGQQDFVKLLEFWRPPGIASLSPGNNPAFSGARGLQIGGHWPSS